MVWSRLVRKYRCRRWRLKGRRGARGGKLAADMIQLAGRACADPRRQAMVEEGRRMWHERAEWINKESRGSGSATRVISHRAGMSNCT